jgi:hypothetical protein
MPGRWFPWAARLSLAAMLAFALEIVLWPQTPQRDMVDIVAALVGYGALAAALLDGIQRERVRNLIGLLGLAGITALLAGLLIHTPTALADTPLTILSRMLGAPTAVVLMALLSWLALLRGRLTSGLLVSALLAGGIWGFYGRWFPSVIMPDAGETPLGTLMVVALVGLGVVVTLHVVLRQPLTPNPSPTQAGRGEPEITGKERNRVLAVVDADRLRLSLTGWLVVAAVLGGLFVLRLSQNAIDSLSLVIVAALIVFVSVILRLYRRPKDMTLLEQALPPGHLRPSLLLVAIGFLAAGVFTYSLPRLEGDADPLGILGTLLLAFGVAWVPALSLIIGGRALMRQMRAEQL